MVNLSQRLSMQLRQSPQQVLLSSLLQLPILSLEHRINLELETNPLLEIDTEMEEELEQEEIPEQTLELEKPEDSDEEEEVDYDTIHDQKEEEEIDWEAVLNDQDSYEHWIPREKDAEQFERPEVYRETLTDHLLNQLHLTDLSDQEMAIGEHLIWNINSSGYLATDVDSVAETFDADPEVVEKVLEVIQHFDPPGIGARNLQECLLIQLLEQEDPHPLAVTIIRDYFDDFKNLRFEKLAKTLGVSLDEVKEAIEEIKKLNPKPGEGYVAYEDNYVVPDMTVVKEDGEFKVILNDWNIPSLRISKSYRQMLADKKNTPKEARDYIRQRLESARWLINSIQQRRQTIIRVMEAIIRRQRDFFEYGPEHIKPMILKDIADDIGMDISTVSRVTNGKYVQTEFGVFELKYFFSEKIHRDDGEDVSNRVIKNRIKEIIQKEDPKRPLNDQKIAEMLKAEGYNVARRTVAKYREQMMIPIARLRRGL
ncbi:MAG: RNA polymerase factor sigma-54 [candidate division KSB1 bacterium]|nr:RNA polymerase factor sigma-54 [candidate division KSB1 bacterium]MDZ7393126.1 RNA polymerase factor sigma-54 [candidate division KSB1 bacterium]MDZ7413393.1 RNA polymerase factor sigma-54 [candidate division KSB1 bacterium]